MKSYKSRSALWNARSDTWLGALKKEPPDDLLLRKSQSYQYGPTDASGPQPVGPFAQDEPDRVLDFSSAPTGSLMDKWVALSKQAGGLDSKDTPGMECLFETMLKATREVPIGGKDPGTSTPWKLKLVLRPDVMVD